MNDPLKDAAGAIKTIQEIERLNREKAAQEALKNAAVLAERQEKLEDIQDFFTTYFTALDRVFTYNGLPVSFVLNGPRLQNAPDRVQLYILSKTGPAENPLKEWIRISASLNASTGKWLYEVRGAVGYYANKTWNQLVQLIPILLSKTFVLT